MAIRPSGSNGRLAPGYFGFSGYPWAGPPFGFAGSEADSMAAISLARGFKNAWREVEVCS